MGGSIDISLRALNGSTTKDHNCGGHVASEVVKAVPLGVAPPAPPPMIALGTQGGDPAGITPTRRPRGRPAGSKNKPKPPIIITRENGNALRAHAMEVSSGCDVSESLVSFARKKQRGICVLSGIGFVTNVTLHQPDPSSPPSSSATSTVTLHGRFEILSLLGSILPPPAPPGVTGLTVYLAGPQGQVVGGSMVGSLIASGPVVIMAATFMNATFDRLPLCDDEPHHHELVPVQNHHNYGQHHQGHHQQQQSGNRVPHHLHHNHHHHVDNSGFYGLPPNLLSSNNGGNGGGAANLGPQQPAEPYAWGAGRTMATNT